MLQRVYNYRLSRARRIVENVFGIMSARFRVLRTPINLNAEKTKKVVLACCVLHNYLMSDKKIYAPPQTYDNGDQNSGTWRQDPIPENLTMFSLQRRSHGAHESLASTVQKEFTAYFVEEGELEWQYNYV